MLPPDPSVCSNANVNPWKPGSAPSTPGLWGNPERNGSGWDLIWSNDHTQLKIVFYTYDRSGRPVWLTSALAALSNTTLNQWKGKLYRLTPTSPSPVAGNEVGSVAISFLEDDPTMLAIAWDWDELRPVAFQTECIQDWDAVSPSFPDGTIGLTMPQGTTYTGSRANQLFSGYWNTTGASNPDSVPNFAFSLRILQNTFPQQPPAGGFVEFDTLLTFDSSGAPVWLIADMPTSTCTPLPCMPSPPPLLNSGTGGLIYSQPDPNTYPNGIPLQDCSATATNPNNCTIQQQIGTVTRNITNDRTGTQGNVTIDWTDLTPTDNFNTPAQPQTLSAIPADSTQTTIKKITNSDGIMPVQYSCQVPSSLPTSTCPIWVVWNSAAGTYFPWRHNLNNGSYSTTALSTSPSNEYVDALFAGDRVQYELWSGSPTAGGTMLDQTAEVRAYGATPIGTTPPSIPDSPIVSLSGDLPTHDPTVGTAAGEAGVDGGASTYRISIPVPPGRNGMQPDIGLTYNSRAGNGIAGLGWSLSGASSIHRCPQTVAQDGVSRSVNLDASDRLCLDGQRLMVTGSTYGASGATYRTEVDSFVQVKETGSIGSSGTTFTVQQKDGRTLVYGGANGHCSGDTTWAVVPPGSSSVALSWLLQQVTDPTGNRMDYCYATGAAGETLLQSIYYTGNASTTGTRQVKFNYATRPSSGGANDWSSSYMVGVEIVQSRRLTSIENWVNGSRTRLFKLTYLDNDTGDDYSLHSGRSILQKLEECSAAGTTCKDATTMTWSDAPIDHIFAPLSLAGIPSVPPDSTYPRRVSVIGDLDGDGAREVLVTQRDSTAGTPWQVYLAKYDADRNVEGTPVNLSPMYSTGIASDDNDYSADIDGDGRSDILSGLGATTDQKVHIYTWKLARGAPLPGGTCTPPTCSLFTDVTTNVPLVRGTTNDLLLGAEDVDGDGYPDLLVVRAGGNCNTGPGSANPVVCVYLNNQTRQVIGPSTSVYNFSSGMAVYTLSGYKTFDRVDINGDGIPDIVLIGSGCQGLSCSTPPIFLMSYDSGGAGVSCLSSVSNHFQKCTAQELGLSTAGAAAFNASGNIPYFLDINGDGLVDMVYASVGGCANISTAPTAVNAVGSWCAQINTGHGFAPILAIPSDAGASIALTADRFGAYAYLGRFPVSDVDGDGHPEILFPSKLATSICRVEKIQVADGTGCAQVEPTSNNGWGHSQPPGSDNNPDFVTCTYLACPEDPSGTYSFPQAPFPPPFSDAIRAVGMYGGISVGGGSYTFNTADNNGYILSALRFVQTGNNSFTATSVSLDASQNGVTHVAIGAPGDWTQNQDLYGDGLPDMIASIGCRATTPSTDCYYSNDGTHGPAALPDGTPVTLASLGAPTQFISENVGYYDRPGHAPFPPELLSRVDNGVGDYAAWDYYPLSSSAPRATDSPPFYALTSSPYADTEYYYFTSSMPAVATMLQNNVNGSVLGARSFVYGYEDAIYDHLGRGFQGFRKIHQAQVLLAGQSNVQVSTTYFQKFPLAGKVAEVDVGLPTTGGAMTNISTQTNTWRCVANTTAASSNAPTRTTLCPGNGGTATAGAYYFPYVDTSVAKTFDLVAAGQGLSNQVTEVDTYNADTAAPTGGLSGWDAYGNLAKQYVVRKDVATSYTDGAFVSAQTTFTNNNYVAADVANWWVNRLNYSEVTNSVTYNASGFSPARTLPSGADPGARTTRTTPAWNTTDRTLSQKVVQDMASGGQQMTAAYGYPTPSYGVPISSTVSATGLATSRLTQFSLSSDGYFAQTVTNAAGHATTSLTRPEDGQVYQVTDPNGLVTKTRFDALGGIVGIDYFKNDGTTLLKPSLNVAVTSCGSSCTGTGELFANYKVTKVQDGTPSQIDWFDSLNRNIKHAERGFDGTWILSTKSIDSMGNVTATTAPFFQGSTSYTTNLVYDALHRLVQKTQPTTELNSSQGNVVTYYTYTGNRTDISVRASSLPQPPTACPASNNLCLSMSRYTSVIGDLMRTVDAQNGTTDYWYDGVGRTIGILDANRSPTSATYTALGYRTALNDPNQGIWNFTYNGLGELVTQTDARGMLTTVTSRDTLGRIVQETEVPPTTVPLGMESQTFRDTWSWDPAGTSGGNGLLGSLKRERGTTLGTVAQVWNESYTYDAKSKRLVSRSTTIEGDTTPFLTQYQYDGYYGRQKAITFPSDFTLWKQYGADSEGDYGDLSSLLDGDTLSPLWSLNQASEYRQPLQEQYGYAISGVNTYTHSTGQMLGQTWTFTNGLWIDQAGYSYDVLGNLTQRTRKPSAGTNASVESYAYDTLQRLGTATKVTQNNSAVNYLYDAVGNLKEKSDYSAASASAYTYGGSGCPGKPNFVTQVTLPSGTDTYTCDANGNIIGGSEFNSSLTTYDADNLPTKITRASGTSASFAYDPMNRRYREILTGSYFLGEGYERVGNGVTATHRHELGPVVVITKSASSDPKHIYYSLRDRLGSTAALADDRDQEPGSVTHRDYDAFGRVRDPQTFVFLSGGLDLDPTTVHGFTNQEHVDNVSLIHMGGRMYDYTLGRFLSVDPIIQDQGGSQALNAYSYILNNPLSGTDPSGYEACTGSHIDRGNEAGDCGNQHVSTEWFYSPASRSGNGATRLTIAPNHYGSGASVLGLDSRAAEAGPNGDVDRNGVPIDMPVGKSEPLVVTPNGAYSKSELAIIRWHQFRLLQADRSVRRDAERLVTFGIGPLAGPLNVGVGFYRSDYQKMAWGAAGTLMLSAPVDEVSSIASAWSAGSIAAEAGSIRNINAVGGELNCVNCAIATDATLAGQPTSAMPGGVTRISVLEKFFSAKFGSPSSIDDISAKMSAAGEGARGVVFGSRGAEAGHVFNVVNQRGTVRFLDGQTGGAASLEGYEGFQLLRTN